jgi:hypothetical protein
MAIDYDNDFDAAVARHNEELLAWLTVPAVSDVNLRPTLETHVNTVLREHNARVHAKMTYLKTGEITNQHIREWTAYVSRKDEHQVARLSKFLRQTLIEPENTGPMSNVALLAYYGRTLLQLRSIYLPDPGPA